MDERDTRLHAGVQWRRVATYCLYDWDQPYQLERPAALMSFIVDVTLLAGCGLLLWGPGPVGYVLGIGGLAAAGLLCAMLPMCSTPPGGRSWLASMAVMLLLLGLSFLHWLPVCVFPVVLGCKIMCRWYHTYLTQQRMTRRESVGSSVARREEGVYQFEVRDGGPPSESESDDSMWSPSML